MQSLLLKVQCKYFWHEWWSIHLLELKRLLFRSCQCMWKWEGFHDTARETLRLNKGDMILSLNDCLLHEERQIIYHMHQRLVESGIQFGINRKDLGVGWSRCTPMCNQLPIGAHTLLQLLRETEQIEVCPEACDVGSWILNNYSLPICLATRVTFTCISS